MTCKRFKKKNPYVIKVFTSGKQALFVCCMFSFCKTSEYEFKYQWLE